VDVDVVPEVEVVVELVFVTVCVIDVEVVVVLLDVWEVVVVLVDVLVLSLRGTWRPLRSELLPLNGVTCKAAASSGIAYLSKERW